MLADIDYTFHQHDETIRRRETERALRAALASRRPEPQPRGPWRFLRRLVGAGAAAALG
jgi:hypothetical protein